METKERQRYIQKNPNDYKPTMAQGQAHNVPGADLKEHSMSGLKIYNHQNYTTSSIQILSCRKNYRTMREERTSSNQGSVNTDLQVARGDNVNVKWSHDSHCSRERVRRKSQLPVRDKHTKINMIQNVTRKNNVNKNKMIIKKGIATW